MKREHLTSRNNHQMDLYRCFSVRRESHTQQIHGLSPELASTQSIGRDEGCGSSEARRRAAELSVGDPGGGDAAPCCRRPLRRRDVQDAAAAAGVRRQADGRAGGVRPPHPQHHPPRPEHQRHPLLEMMPTCEIHARINCCIYHIYLCAVGVYICSSNYICRLIKRSSLLPKCVRRFTSPL